MLIQSLVGTDPSANCPPGQYMCSNGLCVPQETQKFECGIVPSCPFDRPLRCDNGTCVSVGEICVPIIECSEGFELCADGTCREVCPGFNGCGPRMHLCPVSLECEADFEMCQNTSESNLDRYNPTAGYEEIGICTENCFRDLRPRTFAISVTPDLDTTVTAVDDPEFGSALSLTIPAGAIRTGDDSEDTFLVIGPVADSELRTFENFIRRGWMPFFGDFIRYPQTVISPAFRCWRSSNIDTFRLNITVTASIDRTYPHIPRDICLASPDIIDGEWRCVQPLFEDRRQSPIVFRDGNIVSQSMGFCDTVDGDGTIYAFIFTPGSDRPVVDDEAEESLLEQYWIFVAIAVICGATCCTCLFYYCQRQLRYREKYKMAAERFQEKGMELQRMRQVGAAAGNVGAEDVIMETNALQLRVAGDQMNNQLNNLTDLEKLKEMCDAADIEHDKKTEYINTLQSENKKLENVLQELRHEIRQSEAQSLLGHSNNLSMMSASVLSAGSRDGSFSAARSPGPGLIASRMDNVGTSFADTSFSDAHESKRKLL
eukprot:CAMPEP_0184499336 /NCGR_PEP_ID=MMETSP0113_2-20130426/41238_1 /TAXON_ID=91329 /ORGANISM="Norrisiella sphaerica, Strain BC52" /LENGTH=542 /DNA_ID=CAMNT_0026887209 /DNA_START=1026 /DNA_END=2654 /DNA_ORIENTATION=+